MSPHKHLKQLSGPEKHSKKLCDLLKAREEIQRAAASKKAAAERLQNSRCRDASCS